MSSPATNKETIYQLKITLDESKPPIWRRVLVTGDTSLHKLHWIIQAAMGWTNSHLHQFIVDETYYSQPDFGLDEHGDLEVENERTANLGQMGLRPKDRFVYEYDFGDSWRHIITVEKVLERQSGVRYPQVVAGKRACPPEDCGGIWGYDDFLKIIQDKKHPEYKETLAWAGGSFDPEAFVLEEANQELRRVFR
ncbi:MAG: plasmid pRiA4b ORF-3 family protein [Pyrinomonadaceae bacterium]|nr:plasmid pRiA4b ORF-3 family protein [Pyrinomonadaceae bacterium]